MNKTPHTQPWKRLFFLLLFPMLLLFAQEEKPQALEEVISPIGLSEIPTRLSSLGVRLSAIEKSLKEDEKVREVDTMLPSYTHSIQALLDDPLHEYLDQLTISLLNEKESEWGVYVTLLEKWDKRLIQRTKRLKEIRGMVQERLKLWRVTQTYAIEVEAPEAIMAEVNRTLGVLEKLQNSVKEHYDRILTNSNTIHEYLSKINRLIERAQEARGVVESRIFYQNEPPFIELFGLYDLALGDYIESVSVRLMESWRLFRIYYLDRGVEGVWFGVISLVLLIFTLIFNYLYRKKRLFPNPNSYEQRRYRFILRPFSATIVLMMLLTILFFPDIPPMAKQFQLLLLIVPIFRLFSMLIDRQTLGYLYLFMGLYLLAMVEKYAEGTLLDARLFSIALSTLLMIYLVYLLSHRPFEGIMRSPTLRRWVVRGLGLFVALMGISILADSYGATLLARRITTGVFVTLYTSILFYVLAMTLTGYLVILLRRRIASSSLKMGEFTQGVERNSSFVIKLVMFLWWFLIVTQSVGLYGYLVAFKEYLLGLSWQVGSSTLSLLSMIDFLMIVAGSWFLLKLVNVILEVEIYGRFKFARGVPTAITTVSNYLIAITGGFMALSSLGISSEQFTVVAGALGVGIGFGLRNIIANFISGLIMVFERPIQIGDTIEINNTMGRVDGIGTRSSRIKTFDGSEVIIPNADFISKEITNWTLSDERRRKILLFKVALGADIEQILEMMHQIITAHPNVLEDPKPLATFVGFGEYYLEFKAYYWLDKNLIMAQSEITLALYNALLEEGIEMPLPKQRWIQES
jgi:potassium efflux system protein